jgi:hypothetical protein
VSTPCRFAKLRSNFNERSEARRGKRRLSGFLFTPASGTISSVYHLIPLNLKYLGGYTAPAHLSAQTVQ